MADDPVLTFPAPLGDGLLIKVFDPQTGEFGTGFFGQPTLPGGEDGKPERPLPARGLVVAAGPGTYHAALDRFLPMVVAVGDEVLFFDQFAQPIEINGEKLVLLSAENIMVIVSRAEVPSGVRE